MNDMNLHYKKVSLGVFAYGSFDEERFDHFGDFSFSLRLFFVNYKIKCPESKVSYTEATLSGTDKTVTYP